MRQRRQEDEIRKMLCICVNIDLFHVSYVNRCKAVAHAFYSLPDVSHVSPSNLASLPCVVACLQSFVVATTLNVYQPLQHARLQRHKLR